MEDELKRLNDENQYMRSAFNILCKNVIIREEKPQMELKPPEILKDDKELIDLTQSIAVVSHKFYSLEMELDYICMQVSKLTSTIAGTERNNDTESSKINNVEATARQPRNISAQMTDLSPQYLKLEKDLKRITSAWMTMKKKESDISGFELEKANMKAEYEKSFNQFRAECAELKTTNKTLTEQLTSANVVLTAVENEKGQMKQELIHLNDEYEKLKTTYQALEEKLKNAYSDLKEIEGEKANMKNDFDRFMIDYENLKTTNTALEESLKSGSAELTAAVEENVNMKKEYENKYKTLSADYQKLKRHNKTLEEHLRKWQAYGLEVQKENENMKNNYELLLDKYEQQKTDLENAHRYIRQLDGENKKVRQDMDNFRQEKDTLLTRLSELIGDRLTHDNANLSDSDRPTKLSEFFSEMYDNEWTDAFQELTEELSLSDDHAIRRLLDILMNSFRKCKEITWDRYESLSLIASTLHVKEEVIPSTKTTDAEKALTGAQYLNTTKGPENKSKNEPSISDGRTNPLIDESGPEKQNDDQGDDNQENEIGAEEKKQKKVETKTTMLSSALSIDEKTSLKNIWRSSTISLRNESLTMIYAMLSTGLSTPETTLPKTYKYLKVCCDVCWKMFMQEKPMHLEINAEKQIGQEQLFDTERFRAYTKAGKYVAYVVWPALFLHEGGPMLAKGIAQGCNKVPNT